MKFTRLSWKTCPLIKMKTQTIMAARKMKHVKLKKIKKVLGKIRLKTQRMEIKQKRKINQEKQQEKAKNQRKIINPRKKVHPKKQIMINLPITNHPTKKKIPNKRSKQTVKKKIPKIRNKQIASIHKLKTHRLVNRTIRIQRTITRMRP